MILSILIKKQLYNDTLGNLKTEQKAKPEIISQNRKDLQTLVAKIKQTIEKILDKKNFWAEKMILYSVSTVLEYYLYYCSFYDHLDNCTCYYSCRWNRRMKMRPGCLQTKEVKWFKHPCRYTQKTFWKVCLSITCYCRKYCWCKFKVFLARLFDL